MILAHSSLVSHLVLLEVATAAVTWRVMVARRHRPQGLAQGPAPGSAGKATSHRGSTWPPVVAWAAGWIMVIIATSPPVEAVADRTFTGHMVQHLLLIVGAAPLLVYGATIEMYPGTLPAGLRRHSGTLRPLAPLMAAALFVAVLAMTHLTSIYDRALSSQWIHDSEHVAFLAGAIAVWAVIARGHRAATPARAAAVFAIIAGMAMVSIVLLTAPTPVVDGYLTRLGFDEALRDQRSAAATMWVTGMIITLPLIVLSVWRWASTEQRRAERAEAIEAQHWESQARVAAASSRPD